MKQITFPTVRPAHRREELVRVKDDDDYRPYDTLKAIGFTKEEAKGFLGYIEASAEAQLPPEPKKAPDMEVKFREQKQSRRAQLKNILLIVWGYAFAVWLYVIAVQFLHPDWIYQPFATWLPIRMDYMGEAAFVASFIIITTVTMWHTKEGSRSDAKKQTRRTHRRRRPPKDPRFRFPAQEFS